eukprot:11384841-Alexandrium_andersonii.AAC.1
MLGTAGFFGFQSCCASCPQVSPEVFGKAFRVFVGLHTTLEHDWIERLAQGTLVVRQEQLALRGPP